MERYSGEATHCFGAPHPLLHSRTLHSPSPCGAYVLTAAFVREPAEHPAQLSAVETRKHRTVLAVAFASVALKWLRWPDSALTCTCERCICPGCQADYQHDAIYAQRRTCST
jgi:hypothetical protein